MKILKVDEKWSIEYDPQNNDRPTRLLRYDQDAAIDMSAQKNFVVAMFYALLSKSQ